MSIETLNATLQALYPEHTPTVRATYTGFRITLGGQRQDVEHGPAARAAVLAIAAFMHGFAEGQASGAITRGPRGRKPGN